MPAGAGSGNLAWTPEQGYLGGPAGTPTYYLPGSNARVETAELNRNLLEIYQPGNVEAQEFLAQQLEGQMSVSLVLTDDDFHRLIFNDGFTGFTSGAANSAEWYLGVDTLSGTTERAIKGWAPATATINYNGTTEAVRVTMTGAYGDEERNTSLTTTSPTSGGDEVPGHGAQLDINGTTVTYLDQATLEFANISRLIRGPSQKPLEAVSGNVQSRVTLSATYEGPTRYELALGTPGATTIQTDPDEVSATATFSAGGTTVADYTGTVAVDTYDWSDLVNNDADLSEDIEFRMTGVTGSDPTV